MKCNYCCSGYSVDPAAGDKYCGFCGARLKSIRVFLQDRIEHTGPIYIGRGEPVTLKIRLENRGLLDIDEIGQLLLDQ
ncbi:MAG: hypothetical protein JRD93_00650 [Deltaproteobacteria bacterium]|nr:hypothetical protein [Deltaproteobacteria bacterium]